MRTPFRLAVPGFAVGTAEGERCFRFRPLYARASLAFRKLSVWLIVGIAISLAEPGFAGQSFDDEFDAATKETKKKIDLCNAHFLGATAAKKRFAGILNISENNLI